MPITPFHFGPGLLVKAAAPSMSFLGFALGSVEALHLACTLATVIGGALWLWRRRAHRVP